MKFHAPLVKATLVRRYKRFLADVILEDGTATVAHCANSGSMKGCWHEGATVWLAPSPNPKAKLDWRWELIEIDGGLVGINTSRPNHIVEEAILNGTITELQGYETLRREVKYGTNSRIDLLLESPGQCFVEVKNVTLAEGDLALFPDAVTTRGTKHLKELEAEVAAGNRGVMVYLVQRTGCLSFSTADDIDPVYGAALRQAVGKGVEALAYTCTLSTDEVVVDQPLPIRL